MDFILDNGKIKVTVASLGAELRSLVKDGREYIWQGNPDYWTGHAPNLFPICGRVKEGKYTYRGQEFAIKSPHGFARISEFEVEEQTSTKITLVLKDSETSHKAYPFAFEYRVTHEICGASLKTTYHVINPGSEEMIFSVGGHPGFNLPFEENEKFEDIWLEFDKECAPTEVVCDNCYPTGERKDFALIDGKKLPLRHDLFDNDAVFLSDLTCRRVTLRSPKSERFVRVCFDDFCFVGLWHKPLCEAPYMCVEPWTSIPSLVNAEENFETKAIMTRLAPGKDYTASIEISVN